MALSGPSPFAARNNVPRNPPLSSLGTSPFPSHIAGRGASQAQLNSPLSSAHPTHGLVTPTFVAYITPNLPLACRHTPPTPLPRPPRVPPFLRPAFHSTDTHLRSNSATRHISAPRNALLPSSIASSTPLSLQAAACCSSRVVPTPNHSLKQTAAAVACRRAAPCSRVVSRSGRLGAALARPLAGPPLRGGPLLATIRSWLGAPWPRRRGGRCLAQSR